MNNSRTDISCRLGRLPDKQGPRSQPRGTGCDKFATTTCANCGKLYQRKLPFDKHMKQCTATNASSSCPNSSSSSSSTVGLDSSSSSSTQIAKNVSPSQPTSCSHCGKNYKYIASLRKHETRCRPNRTNASQSIFPSPTNRSTTSQLHIRSRNVSHPERLKVIVWKACKNNKSPKSVIRDVRRALSISRDIPTFIRGKKRSKRVEVWCKDRQATVESFNKFSNLCRLKSCPYFCTLGREYAQRSRSRDAITDFQTSDTSNDPPEDTEEHTSSMINVLQWNAQSINNKVDEIRLLLHEQRIDVACICETRIKDSSLWMHKFKGYTTHNFARPNREGGGTCIILREKYGISQTDTMYTDSLEYIQMEITINKSFGLFITSLYARDGSKKITDTLDKIPEKNHSLITGDFNAKHTLWGSTKISPSGNALLDWVNDRNLIILNKKEHTFQSHSTGLTDAIDITISSSDLADKVAEWKVLADSLGSDHFPIVTTFETPGAKNSSVYAPRWNIRKADRLLFKSLSDATVVQAWPDMNDPDKNLEDKVGIVTSCITQAAEKSYPLSKNGKRLPTPWWSKDIEAARTAKRKARKKWKQNHSLVNMIAYKKQQAQVKRMIKAAKRTSWKQFVGSINRMTPSSIIWKRIKAINGVNRNRETALEHDGRLITDPEEQANLFGEYYSQKCHLVNPAYNPEEHSDFANTIQSSIDLLCEAEDQSDLPFTLRELDMALDDLKPSATGEDRVHNQMLKDLTPNGKNVVLGLFNEIWESGTYPNSWKVSKIIPLLKPNKDKQKIKSYRPVALTSCLGKLLERIINRRLSWRMEKEKIFFSSQCGFRPKAGTLDALLKITEQCQEGIYGKKYTVIVFLDLEGAFDKVWWEGLLNKAAQVGISGNMLKSLRSFLSERDIKVQVGSEVSRNFHINAGTPQGAVISPTIFNIMMYDLPSIVEAPCKQVTYADDCTLMMTHSNLSFIVETLNACLEDINQWAAKWKMKVSQEKTEYTVITRKRKHLVPIDSLGLTLEGENIGYNRNPRILGLTLDPVLSWQSHVDNLVVACTKRLNLMKAIASNHWGADLSTLRAFYLAYIRSKISYAMEIWSSCSKTQFQRLSKIQNAALRLMTGALKTTPIAALEIEADIPPLDLFMEMSVLRRRIKQHFMPKDSPGCICKTKAPSSFYQRSSALLQDREIKLPKRSDVSFNNTTIIHSTPPWLWNPPQIQDSLSECVTKSDNPSLLQQLSLKMINEDFENYTQVYTDGSLDSSKGIAGAGVHFQNMNRNIILPLPPSSILKAELVALERALEEIKSQDHLTGSEYVIFTDSKSSLQSLQSYKPSEYHQHCEAIRNLISSIPSPIVLQWIPSHVGIQGNEQADQLAKTASLSGPVSPPVADLPTLNCTITRKTKQLWLDRWNSGGTGRFYYDFHQHPNKCRYSNITRGEQVTLSRIMFGHLPCQSYLHRFNLVDNPQCLLCNAAEETISHILLECPELATHRQLDTRLPLNELLQNKNNEWSSILNIVKERKMKIHARV